MAGFDLSTEGRGRWEFNAMAVRPAAVLPGAFDDRTTTQRFWGAGVIAPHPLWRRARLSAYYLGLEKDPAVLPQGLGVQRRHTLGPRSWATSTTWDANVEGIVQWGRFGSASIRAGALSLDIGRTWRRRWQPRLGLRSDVASGDRDAFDRQLNTFDPLFPSATAYSRVATLSPAQRCWMSAAGTA